MKKKKENERQSIGSERHKKEEVEKQIVTASRGKEYLKRSANVEENCAQNEAKKKEIGNRNKKSNKKKE